MYIYIYIHIQIIEKYSTDNIRKLHIDQNMRMIFNICMYTRYVNAGIHFCNMGYYYVSYLYMDDTYGHESHMYINNQMYTLDKLYHRFCKLNPQNHD